MRPVSRDRQRDIGALALVVGMVLVGCSGDPGPEASPASVAAPRPTATTVAPGTTQPRWDAQQQEVVDAYMAAIDLFHRSQMSGTDPGPSLDEFFADPLLSQMRQNLAAFRQAGRRTRASPDHRARVVVESVDVRDPTTAVLVDCDVDDFVTYDGQSGQVIDDAVDTGHRTETLVRGDSQWKWSMLVVNERTDGESGCASGHRHFWSLSCSE
jgi:hypothetical protein